MSNFNALILTLYPEMFPGALGHSLVGKALNDGLWSLDMMQIRDFANDKHSKVDDTPYGGGAGMVMRADVVGAAIESAQTKYPSNKLINLSPRGIALTQSLAKELSMEDGLTMLCSRFEGVDQRVLDHYQPLEISIGDYILFGGELAAQVVLEAVLRNLPNILGNTSTHDEESFDLGEDSSLLLEYPHYSKPPLWKGLEVPNVLKSGHHGNIKAWRQSQAESVTKDRRDDLWQQYLEQIKD